MSAYSIMGKRIVKLNEIAQHGNIEAFYSLIIREDVRILEDIDELPFVDTPLHIAASAGSPQHIQFAMEMMRLKPSLARKPNLNGYSPIHLALQEGHTQMVHQLLQHNADLVRVKGKECMTPLHHAAKNDNLALLENFLSVCPDSITDVTTRNETALHIALNYNKLEAFKFLVGWLLREWPYWRKILELKDVDGKTILHIAVFKNQTQAVSHLLDLGPRFVNIEKNLGAQTALDILDEQRRRRVDNSVMRDILNRAGALTASTLPTVTSSHEHYLRLPGSCERIKIIYIGNQVRKQITDEKRNALLVVAALLVTVTFQAVVTPPGGLWQDDLFAANTTDVLRRSRDDLFKLNITAPHRAGSAAARGTEAFAMFMIFNSIIFLSSIATMAVLVPPDGVVGMILAVFSVYLCFGYFTSLMVITQATDWFTRIVLISTLIIINRSSRSAYIYLGYLLNLKWEELKKKYSRA